MIRLASSAVVIAVIVPASGCAILAVPPIVGATVGVSIGAARHRDAGTTVGDAVLGALAGAAVDAGLIYYVLNTSGDSD